MSAPVTGRRSPRWAFMARMEIPDYNNPEQIYLRRLRIIQTPWFGVYLHHIFLPDADRAPHDHPWPFASLVLRGGYSERIHPRPRQDLAQHHDRFHRSFSLHRTSCMVAHRILDLKPNTVTLVLVGPRRRDWGFWEPSRSLRNVLGPVPGVFVPWEAFEHAGPDPFDS